MTTASRRTEVRDSVQIEEPVVPDQPMLKALVESYKQAKERTGTAGDVSGRGTSVFYEGDDLTARLKMPSERLAPDPAPVYFISTQEWDGYVVRVSDDKFEAVIYPVGQDAEYRQDVVTVPFEIVDDDVRRSVCEGSIFRMATGRQRRKRQVMHGVKIYFRPAGTLSNAHPSKAPDLEALFAD